MKSARVPLVIHILLPLMTYSSPTRRAVVRMLATSEPQPGSLTPSAPMRSPASAGTRNSRFCSSVPSAPMTGVAICAWTRSAMFTPAFWLRASSSVKAITNQ